MAEAPSQEGDITFAISTIDQPCFTHFKVFGDLSVDRAAVVVLHGGPGAGHEYLLPFAELWPRYGLPVIFYDQLGCASSTKLPHKVGDEEFWQESLFVSELDNLLDFFGLRDRASGFHIFGQSWGGGLGAAFASTQPKGLRRLVLASGTASRELSARGTNLLLKDLPSDVQKTFKDAVEKNAFATPEYQGAMAVLMRKHLCRMEPFPPPELLPTLKNLSEKTVYDTMYISPLAQLGSLRNSTTIPRLPKINVPTLVYNGELDTSHDIAQRPFFELIPKVRWVTFPGGGHMCHLEPPLRERILKTVGEFLTQTGVHEASGGT